MDARKAAKNWKITAAVLFVAVVILLLLWPKLRQALADLIFGPIEIGGINLGDVTYPNITFVIEDNGGDGTNDGGTCGCETRGQELIDEAMAYFVQGMRDIQADYLAGILASRPDWTLQFWNNALGYSMSQSSGAFFGGPGNNTRGF